jgi:hypothetical protein
MKQRNKNIYEIAKLQSCLVILLLIFATACKKQDQFLDAKRQKSDVVPSTLTDFQAILDNTFVMNEYYADLALDGADNNYITDANLGSAQQYEQNAYLWAKDIFQGGPSYDWNYAYQMVEYANIVLDGLPKIDPTTVDQASYNNVRGSALFYRSMAFYELAQAFCKPYSSGTSSTDLGIPIRLSSDVNIKSTRATVQQSYDQMIADLKTAIGLLPATPLYTTRPSSVSAAALLAKVYLTMEDYNNAGIYANQTLQNFSTLLDFNNSAVSASLDYRFPTFQAGNPEVIFYAESADYFSTDSYPSDFGYTDASLYASYSANDLRKTLFYQDYGNGVVKFQGNYTGTYNNFAGIATNEIYLIRAESYARAGNITAAMMDLNNLLSKRYKSGTFTPLAATSSDAALRLVLQERRKELPYTGQLRWEDLRRLNKDPRFSVTLQRVSNGVTYTLPPNDKRYVFPIPDLEIQLYGLQQNDR